MIVDWDDAYANMAHIPEAEALPARWAADASAFRENHPPKILRYGDHARHAVDLFLPGGPPRGLAIWIHGGYWRAFDRGDWSHYAAGALARGWAVALPGFVLAPEVPIAAMTRDVARAIEAVAGTVSGPIRLSGHSAGGHLATRMVCDDAPLTETVVSRVDRVLSISGVHDLRPLLRTTLNAEFLRLDEEMAAAESPVLRMPRADMRVNAWVGGDERPEFLRQTALLANIWTGLGADMTETVEPGLHHFAIIEGLRDPDSRIVEAFVGA